MTDPRLTFLADVAQADAAELAGRLTNTPIVIVLGDEASGRRGGQLLAAQLISLLARLFDRVSVQAPEVPNLIGESLVPGPTLVAALTGLAQAVRPPVLTTPGVDRPPLRIQIGSAGPSGIAERIPHLYLGATDWTACVSVREPSPVADCTLSVGPLAAAALGASEAFKLVFADVLRGTVQLGRDGRSGYHLSLLTYGPETTAVPNLPDEIAVDLTLVGGGSIGCALLEGLLMTPQLHGEIVVVDNGFFDERNPYKYVGLDWGAAAAKRPKAPWAARRVERVMRGRVRGRSFLGTIDDYVASLPADYRIPLLVSAVDTVEARLSAQDALPRRIVNAGIDGVRVEVSSHGFGAGACLACVALQSNRETWDVRPVVARVGLAEERIRALIASNGGLTAADVDVMRAAAVLPAAILEVLDSYLGQPVLSLYQRAAYAEATAHTAAGTEVRITTAFVSAFAGALVLAEVLKECVPTWAEYRVANSYRQDLLGVPAEDRFRYERDATGACLCHSGIRRQAYDEKYGATS